MVILMIYSCIPIGDLRFTVESSIRQLFSTTQGVSGSEGIEGWNIDLCLPCGVDSRVALNDLLLLLRTLPVPHDTYVVYDATEEHYVFEDGETADHG